MRAIVPMIMICLLGLSGCSSLSYSVSEATLEEHLQEAVADYDREQLGAGSPLALKLDSSDIVVGPDGRDVVRLDLAGQASFNAFASQLPADITLSLEGTPYYDNDDQAVYLRRLALLDSRIEAPWLPVDLGPLTQMAVRLVAQTLENVPVYRLEMDDFSWKERALARGVTLKVKPGRLVLQPGL